MLFIPSFLYNDIRVIDMKKLNVNKEACIGCGACAAMVPDVFDLGEDGYAEVINSNYEKELEEDVMDALEGCPTNEIAFIEEESKDEE